MISIAAAGLLRERTGQIGRIGVGTHEELRTIIAPSHEFVIPALLRNYESADPSAVSLMAVIRIGCATVKRGDECGKVRDVCLIPRIIDQILSDAPGDTRAGVVESLELQKAAAENEGAEGNLGVGDNGVRRRSGVL